MLIAGSLLLFLLVAFGPYLFGLELSQPLEGLRLLIAFVTLTPILGKLTDYLRERRK
jgi:hypothetical protein